MNLKGISVKAIIYPHGEYHLGKAVPIIDEGSFYRIDGTHILDKHKIKEVVQEEGRIKIVMTDKLVILEVSGNPK